MATKRQLKKFISRACDEAAYACLITDCSSQEDVTDKITDLLVDLTQLKSQAICAASFSFDKTEADFSDAKAYHEARRTYNKEAYNHLLKEFETKLQDIINKLNALNKASK